jgi:type I restriction enzyme S subunit
LERRARTSAGIYKIAQPDIVSAPIPVPSLSEQAHAREMFKQQMVQINAMQTTLDVGLKQATGQRQNILRAAFSGQLVPQDPNDEPASELLSRIRADRTERVAVKKPRGRQVRAL